MFYLTDTKARTSALALENEENRHDTMGTDMHVYLVIDANGTKRLQKPIQHPPFKLGELWPH
jgi:hypothetical protein